MLDIQKVMFLVFVIHGLGLFTDCFKSAREHFKFVSIVKVVNVIKIVNIVNIVNSVNIVNTVNFVV